MCAPDLRGIGDLTPEFGRHSARNAREHANDEMWAWSSLVLGKPLAGQRVTDLLAVVQGLRARPDLKGKPLVLAARGFSTVPALFAAALEPAIDRLYLAGGLVSFQSIVDTEDYNHPFGNFVPNLLLHTDLPRAGCVHGAATRRTGRRRRWCGETMAAGRRPQAVRRRRPCRCTPGCAVESGEHFGRRPIVILLFPIALRRSCSGNGQTASDQAARRSDRHARRSGSKTSRQRPSTLAFRSHLDSSMMRASSAC